MDQRIQIITNAAMDLIYNPNVRRWGSRVLGTIFGIWLLLIVLGIEVLTSTAHQDATTFGITGPYIEERYTCWYWTGFGYRYQEESPYGFTRCPLWRWGRQFPG